MNSTSTQFPGSGPQVVSVKDPVTGVVKQQVVQTVVDPVSGQPKQVLVDINNTNISLNSSVLSSNNGKLHVLDHNLFLKILVE